MSRFCWWCCCYDLSHQPLISSVSDDTVPIEKIRLGLFENGSLNPVMAELSEGELNGFLSSAEEVTLEKGEIVMKQGHSLC